MGSVFIIFLGSAGILLVIGIMQPCLFCNFSFKLKLLKIFDYLEKKFLWNYYIIFFAQPTLQTCLSGYLNLKYGVISKDSTTAQVMNYVVCVINVVGAVATPYLLTICYNINFKKLSTSSYR